MREKRDFLRIANWNIDQGGCYGMVDKIIKTLLGIKADVIVLPEFRNINFRVEFRDIKKSPPYLVEIFC